MQRGVFHVNVTDGESSDPRETTAFYKRIKIEQVSCAAKRIPSHFFTSSEEVNRVDTNVNVMF